jgi:hypothetical protein
MEDSLLRFVLARTERNTKRPYLDDLSHHNLAIAFSQLHLNDPTAVMAGLLHDFFKGLLFFKNSNWNHLAEEKQYKKVIPDNIKNVNKAKLLELIYHHHKRHPDGKIHRKIWKKNPIRFAESGGNNLKGIVGTLESGIFISQEEDIYGLNNFKITPHGRYYWLLIAVLYEELRNYLSKLYSRKLKELLDISSLEFRYVPVTYSDSHIKFSQCVQSINPEEYCPFSENNHFAIPLPVKNLSKKFTIIYNDTENIELNGNTLTIPFGVALTFLAFTGNEIVLSFVNPGYDIDMATILEKALKKSKKGSNFPYSMKNLEESVNAKYTASDSCSFCGSPASEAIPAIAKRDRFTDINMFSDDRGIACPICFAGYLLEQDKVPYIKPQEAEIYEVDVDPPFKGKFANDFATSASGLMWQQTLSAIWYKLFISGKSPEFVLDPRIRVHPITARFVPKAFFPMAWKSGNKKYCLQSNLTSGLTALGALGNITTEKFKEISRTYRITKNRIDKEKMLKKIKYIYGIKK